MQRALVVVVLFCAILDTVNCGISTKLDFDEEQAPLTKVSTDSSKTDDEDVEVLHTIVVSTKLRNKNERKGIHSFDDGGFDGVSLSRSRQKTKKDDSGEVPVYTGYKGVVSTRIRTPDTRLKPKYFPETVFINHNVRDQYDIYPNTASNSAQWKPSTLFKNVNWWNEDNSRDSVMERSFNGGLVYPRQEKLQRKITDDGLKTFYCQKCRELSRGKGCFERESSSLRNIDSTTAKVKIDGKLVKLD